MRIFWLGMHKILVKTELPRLRTLGYEVFNPPYFEANQLHQSAIKGFDSGQPTTLPKDVFERLASYNFFFNPISPETGEILNQYFDVVIVTIDPQWLIEILRVFKNKIIYRTYGHVANMSEHLFAQDAFRAITEKKDFWYVPHSLESALCEHLWLRERIAVVPYTPTEDVTAILDSWDPSKPKQSEIMLSCPNLTNPFFGDHYQYLKRHFNRPEFRFYGVQMKPYPDPQIVGTVRFENVLKKYSECAGFLYTYRNPTVCFMPPVEMMIAGGPVIYLSGSLLDKYFHPNAPGRATTEQEAIDKCERLLKGDRSFAKDIIHSQGAVRDRYLPEKVWPKFDETFKQLLSSHSHNSGYEWTSRNSKAPHVYLLSHLPGRPIEMSDGEYQTSVPELLRAKDQIGSILKEGKQVIATCRYDQVPYWHGFFSPLRSLGSFALLCSDRELALNPARQIYQHSKLRSQFARFVRVGTKIANRIKRVFGFKTKQYNYLDCITNDSRRIEVIPLNNSFSGDLTSINSSSEHSVIFAKA